MKRYKHPDPKWVVEFKKRLATLSHQDIYWCLRLVIAAVREGSALL